MEKLNYINSLNPILISVNEKINKKYLMDFLKDKIKQHNALQSDIYYTYMQYSKQYQITYCEKKLPFMYIFESYYKNKNQENNKDVDLFFNQDFFVIYSSQELYFYKKNNNNSIRDILKYVKYELNLSVTNIVSINPSDFILYKEDYLKDNKHNLKNYYMVLIFLIYVFILTSSLYLYYEKSKDIISIDSKKFSEIQKSYFVHDVSRLFKHLKKYKLTLLEFEYRNNELNLLLYTKSLKNFYSFLGEKNIHANFSYVKKKVGYEIHAIFDL